MQKSKNNKKYIQKTTTTTEQITLTAIDCVNEKL